MLLKFIPAQEAHSPRKCDIDILLAPDSSAGAYCGTYYVCVACINFELEKCVTVHSTTQSYSPFSLTFCVLILCRQCRTP